MALGREMLGAAGPRQGLEGKSPNGLRAVADGPGEASRSSERKPVVGPLEGAAAGLELLGSGPHVLGPLEGVAGSGTVSRVFGPLEDLARAGVLERCAGLLKGTGLGGTGPQESGLLEVGYLVSWALAADAGSWAAVFVCREGLLLSLVIGFVEPKIVILRKIQNMFRSIRTFFIRKLCFIEDYIF